MSASIHADTVTGTGTGAVPPFFPASLAALSAGAAAIHFAVVLEHFAQYALYGVFFLVIAWAQLIWPAVLLWRQPRPWLRAGIAGNAAVIAVYVASRTTGLPLGPDLHHPEPAGALDVTSCVLELALIAGCAALLWRPRLADRVPRRPAGRRGAIARTAALAAVPAAVIAATAAVMTPGWTGPAGHPGVTAAPPPGTPSHTPPPRPAAAAANPAMAGMRGTGGRPDMRMYGSNAPPTAAQVLAAAQLIRTTDASLKRYASIRAALAAGYTYVLRTNGEEHLLYNGTNPSYQGLHPRHPSSLVYAINLPHHAPILLGAMYIMADQASGPQIGGGLTRWHTHLVICANGHQAIAGFGVRLRDTCNAATWHDTYTPQMLHVWIVPYPGGVFSDDLTAAATRAAVHAALTTHS